MEIEARASFSCYKFHGELRFQGVALSEIEWAPCSFILFFERILALLSFLSEVLCFYRVMKSLPLGKLFIAFVGGFNVAYFGLNALHEFLK